MREALREEIVLEAFVKIDLRFEATICSRINEAEKGA